MKTQRRILWQSVQYAALWWLGGFVGAPLIWAVKDLVK